jgi:hypothetical protein
VFIPIGRFGGPPEREADVLRRALALVTERLPPGWSIGMAQETALNRQIDALFDLLGPDRTTATFVVEAKRSVVTRDLPALLDRLRSYIMVRRECRSSRRAISAHRLGHGLRSGACPMWMRRATYT